jgi:hypothetical protein
VLEHEGPGARDPEAYDFANADRAGGADYNANTPVAQLEGELPCEPALIAAAVPGGAS